MDNEFTPKNYKEIRKRGHFTIIDDGSVQDWLSRRLLNNSGGKNAKIQ